tara:strand:+ start:126 stop:344 length:219 start_codon:yes stop_codon:yes gene_type:complete
MMNERLEKIKKRQILIDAKLKKLYNSKYKWKGKTFKTKKEIKEHIMKDRPTLLLEYNKIHATGIKEIDEALK